MNSGTVGEVLSVHGTNPQFLIEKIIRERIYDSLYWKDACFGLTAATLLDKVVELDCIGGLVANKPTPFLCLTLKLLSLQPEKEIVLEYIKNEDFKYLRALGAFYFRLVGASLDIYEVLEPLMTDYRKLRKRSDAGNEIVHIDEFIDQLLREERVCDVILPRLTKREALEESEGLPPRKSVLDELLESEEDEDMEKANGHSPRSRSVSPTTNSRWRGDGYRSSPSKSPSPRRGNGYRSPPSRTPSPRRHQGYRSPPSRTPSPSRNSTGYRSPPSRTPSPSGNRTGYRSPPSRTPSPSRS